MSRTIRSTMKSRKKSPAPSRMQCLERWISRRSRRLTGALRKRKPPSVRFNSGYRHCFRFAPSHAAGTGKSFRHTGNLLPCPDRPFPHPPECRPYALRPSRPGLSRFSSRRGRLFQSPGRRLPPARKCHSDGTPPAPRRLFHPDYHLSV